MMDTRDAWTISQDVEEALMWQQGLLTQMVQHIAALEDAGRLTGPEAQAWQAMLHAADRYRADAVTLTAPLARDPDGAAPDRPTTRH
jgi:hypothetical protein